MKYLCGLLKMPGGGQIILDPFCGSGTTCIAAKSMGINYIGIDKTEDYCLIARKRLEALGRIIPAKEVIAGQGALFE